MKLDIWVLLEKSVQKTTIGLITDKYNINLDFLDTDVLLKIAQFADTEHILQSSAEC
jgi:hypothetical protein